MAATNRPQVLTMRFVQTMSPEDLDALDSLAAKRGTVRTETVRALVREEYQRTARNENDPQ